MIIKSTSLVIFMSLTSPAHCLDQKVKFACMGDYFEFCSNTTPGTQECRQCFINVGRDLSSKCKAAIKSSSEFANDYETQRKRYVQH